MKTKLFIDSTLGRLLPLIEGQVDPLRRSNERSPDENSQLIDQLWESIRKSIFRVKQDAGQIKVIGGKVRPSKFSFLLSSPLF